MEVAGGDDKRQQGLVELVEGSCFIGEYKTEE